MRDGSSTPSGAVSPGRVPSACEGVFRSSRSCRYIAVPLLAAYRQGTKAISRRLRAAGESVRRSFGPASSRFMGGPAGKAGQHPGRSRDRTCTRIGSPGLRWRSPWTARSCKQRCRSSNDVPTTWTSRPSHRLSALRPGRGRIRRAAVARSDLLPCPSLSFRRSSPPRWAVAQPLDTHHQRRRSPDFRSFITARDVTGGAVLVGLTRSHNSGKAASSMRVIKRRMWDHTSSPLRDTSNQAPYRRGPLPRPSP